MLDKRIDELSLTEKAKFVRGKTNWLLESKKELNIKEIKVSDGPHGLRVEIPNSVGVFKPSFTSICFPSACLTSCSFSNESLNKLGSTLAKEAKSLGVNVLLGPGINIKRNPLCGRNFEYFSEDPFLAGSLAATYIKAVQKENIGTSIKHYAVNNQETLRSSINAVVDKRALREIYTYAFEKAIKEAKPYTIMASYNMINGEFACENKYLLTTLARDTFHFDGLIMSDWGAVNDINLSLKAGLDLEMPYNKLNESISIESLTKDPSLVNDYNRAISNNLKIIDKCDELEFNELDEDLLAKHHEVAKDIALDSITLLKNDNNILPLKNSDRVLFVGPFAHTPRYQGGGSSHIISYKVDNFLDLIKDNKNTKFLEGFKLDLSMDDSLINEVIKESKDFDKVVVFLGLTEKMESEGFDRNNLSLPLNQLKLIDELYKNNIKPIIILENGAVVELPFINKISALLECYLGGEAINLAIYDILYGITSPSGRLSETFAYKYEDYPSAPYFPGDLSNVLYKESIFVGYRYFDLANVDVLFPFGYGLSYSSFAYKDLKLTLNEDNSLNVSFKVKNVGSFKAKEVSLIYVSKPNELVFNPLKELKGFSKVELDVNEEKEINYTISKQDLSYFDIALDEFSLLDGRYTILVGTNSRSLDLKETIMIKGNTTSPYKNDVSKYNVANIKNISDEEFSNLFIDNKLPVVKEKSVGNYDINTSITYALKDSKGANLLHEYFLKIDLIKAKPYILKMIEDLPIRMIANNFSLTDINQINAFINLFNDIEIEKSLEIILTFFKSFFNIIIGKK